MKIEIVPLSAVLPTLMSEVGKSLKESACAVVGDKALKGSVGTWVMVLLAPFATRTHVEEAHRMGSFAAARSHLLR